MKKQVEGERGRGAGFEGVSGVEVRRGRGVKRDVI